MKCEGVFREEENAMVGVGRLNLVRVLSGVVCGLCGSVIGCEVYRSIRKKWAGLSMWKVPALSIQSEKDMDTSDNVGSEAPRVLLVCDFDIRRLDVAVERLYFAFQGTSGNACSEALAGLAEAISKGSPSIENKILRRWGIRR